MARVADNAWRPWLKEKTRTVVHDKAGLASVITRMITDADKAPRCSTHDKASLSGRYHSADHCRRQGAPLFNA
jgi:hypothetical protein